VWRVKRIEGHRFSFGYVRVQESSMKLEREGWVSTMGVLEVGLGVQ
jgi:hypothetical protein